MGSILQEADGSYTVMGCSRSYNNGDVTDTTNGGADLWLLKIDASGNILWVPDMRQ
ncbi:hypothetical protein D3C72_2455270 [compost metagenome]